MKDVAESGPEPVVSGVPLAQYAAVTAALAQPFPLKAVLAVEGLAAARWAEADRGWTARLAEDAALLGRYEAELAVAQERLARTVEPIDADLGAWIAFRAAIARAPEAAGMLDALGLGADDAARLERRWAARMRQDPALERRAAEIQQQGPGPLPPLRVVKGKLTASGMGLAPTAPATPEPAARLTAPEAPRPPPAQAVAPPPPAAPPDPVPRLYTVPRVYDDPDEEDGTVTTFQAQRAPLPFQATPSHDFLEAIHRPGAAPGAGSDGTTAAFRVSAALRALAIPEPPERPRVQLPEETTVTGVVSPFAGKPLPFDEPARAAPPAHPPRTPVPAPPPLAEPPLSLERHASLCLELAVYPAHTGDVLARYRVSAADKARADEFYRARIEADPEVRARWNRAFEIYRAWFMSRLQP